MHHFYRMHSSYKKMQNESTLNHSLLENSKSISPVLENPEQKVIQENLSQLQTIFPNHEQTYLIDLLKKNSIQNCIDILLQKDVQKQINFDFQLAKQMEK